MPITTAKQLFVHELEDVYDAEKRILNALPKLAGEATDAKFRNELEHHQQETRTQIQNLEQVFEMLGHRPQTTTCHGAQGLIQEHDHFVQEGPSSDVLE